MKLKNEIMNKFQIYCINKFYLICNSNNDFKWNANIKYNETENKLAEKIQENSKNYGILNGWKISLISPALQSSFQCFKTMFLTDVYDYKNVSYYSVKCRFHGFL